MVQINFWESTHAYRAELFCDLLSCSFLLIDHIFYTFLILALSHIFASIRRVVAMLIQRKINVLMIGLTIVEVMVWILVLGAASALYWIQELSLTITYYFPRLLKSLSSKWMNPTHVSESWSTISVGICAIPCGIIDKIVQITTWDREILIIGRSCDGHEVNDLDAMLVLWIRCVNVVC